MPELKFREEKELVIKEGGNIVFNDNENCKLIKSGL